ncbi:hypothetical protein [Geotalea toluenoxydans]|uniref:hypothetical protein n=1 Tax=Geotalea toluenoxydans TaxID=421624 RepID=UPI0006D17CC4|nr:hypothetical protein [Geotalea toluenoxydans]
MKFGFRMVLLAASLLMFSGCNFGYIVKENFDKTSRSYATMLRWQEFDAGVAYVDAPLRDDYRKRVEAARGIRVLDSRILSKDCDTEAKKAEVVMELDYNISPSTTVRTVTDLQKWRYFDEGEKKGWRLESLLPEFK